MSKYVGKVEVEIMNIEDRTRVRILGRSATKMGFVIQEVRQSRNFIEETVVVLLKGNESAEVTYNPKFLALRKASQRDRLAVKKFGSSSDPRARL